MKTRDLVTLTRASLASILLSGAAVAQEFTFSIHHFLSPNAATQTVLLEPWAAAVSEASGGHCL